MKFADLYIQSFTGESAFDVGDNDERPAQGATQPITSKSNFSKFSDLKYVFVFGIVLFVHSSTVI